jgi:hypothetical protein
MNDDKQDPSVANPTFDHESIAEDVPGTKFANELEHNINQPNVAIYAEALARYPNDESIDRADEKKLRRKLDRRIIPLLGMCYFFYVSNNHYMQWTPIKGYIALCSTLTRPHCHMQRYLASKTIFLCVARNIRGFLLYSTLDGCSGQFHPI